MTTFNFWCMDCNKTFSTQLDKTPEGNIECPRCYGQAKLMGQRSVSLIGVGKGRGGRYEFRTDVYDLKKEAQILGRRYEESGKLKDPNFGPYFQSTYNRIMSKPDSKTKFDIEKNGDLLDDK